MTRSKAKRATAASSADNGDMKIKIQAILKSEDFSSSGKCTQEAVSATLANVVVHAHEREDYCTGEVAKLSLA